MKDLLTVVFSTQWSEVGGRVSWQCCGKAFAGVCMCCGEWRLSAVGSGMFADNALPVTHICVCKVNGDSSPLLKVAGNSNLGEVSEESQQALVTALGSLMSVDDSVSHLHFYGNLDLIFLVRLAARRRVRTPTIFEPR